jgi:hypothetical protein
MKIKGLEGISLETLEHEVQQGGRFVVYTFVVSVILMTFKRSSAVHYFRPHMGSVGPGLKYTLITLLFGWWGIPWGPIYSIGGLVANFRGGKNVTIEVMNALYAERGPRVPEVQIPMSTPGMTQNA